MAGLAERYMRDYVPSHCTASSAAVYRTVLDNHILSALGGMPVGTVGREQVTDLHYAMRGSPHAANEALKIVAKMLSLPVEWGLREPGANPCRAVCKYKTRPRERFLTGEEYGRLGRAVDEPEAAGTMSRHAAAAIRLLVLSGCRRNEVLELRWDDIDRTTGELRLRGGKTGARPVPLTPEMQGVLDGIPRIADNPWVISGQKPGAHLTDINTPWLTVRAHAGLGGVRIHDLRHSFASRALALGESLSMIGKLLGHNRIDTTARYAHLARGAGRTQAAVPGLIVVNRVEGTVRLRTVPQRRGHWLRGVSVGVLQYRPISPARLAPCLETRP